MRYLLWLTFFLSLLVTVSNGSSADTTGPVIIITAPEEVLYKTNTMWANVSLNEDGLWCKYSLDHSPNVSLGGGPVNWNILLNVEDGFHNITYFCSDLSGNINQSRYHYIMVDATPPQISLEVYPEPVESFKNIRLRINCSDEVSGCDTVDIKIPFANCLTKVSKGTLYEVTTPYCVAQTYEYRVNATDNIGNANSSIRGTITVKKATGCDCSSNAECMDGSCILGKCMTADNPSLKFYFNRPETIEGGNYWTLIIWLKNNLDVEDTISLKLTGIPEKIEYWSSFENGDKSMNFRLGPHEETFTTINTFGGKVGTYMLYIDGRSLSVPTLFNQTGIRLHVVAKKNAGLLSRSPGVSNYSCVIIFAISLLVMFKRNSF